MYKPFEIRVFSAADINEILTYPACIELLEQAMVETSKRRVELPLRSLMQAPNQRGVLGLMPGAMATPSYLGTKLISMFEGNTAQGLSSHMGMIALFRGEDGLPAGLFEAGSLTAIRTASASALATRYLSREDSRTLAIIGTGEEAATHLQAMLSVRPFTHILIWGRSPEKVSAFLEKNAELRNDRGDLVTMGRAETIEQAVAEADVICTVTASKTPILKGAWLRPGQHVNLVGASVRVAAEADSDVVTRSHFYVDYLDSAMAQAGELLAAIEQGLVDRSHVKGEIGAVIAGDIEGRMAPDEITVYKSLGIASQDIASAAFILDRGRELGRGQVVTL